MNPGNFEISCPVIADLSDTQATVSETSSNGRNLQETLEEVISLHVAREFNLPPEQAERIVQCVLMLARPALGDKS